MIGEEPYRWLEAVQNRREYIEDLLRPAQAVVAVSGDPGILLLTVRASNPKIFEVYDRLAIGCLGHPADLETVRQAAIDTAHLEGFARSPSDVGSRRLMNYSLGPALKKAFEQVFAAPLIFRGLLAELGNRREDDRCWAMEYDGTYRAVTSADFAKGAVILGESKKPSPRDAAETLESTPGTTWPEVAATALRWVAWARSEPKGDAPIEWASIPTGVADLLKEVSGDRLELAVLDRAISEDATYRVPSLDELGLTQKV